MTAKNDSRPHGKNSNVKDQYLQEIIKNEKNKIEFDKNSVLDLERGKAKIREDNKFKRILIYFSAVFVVIVLVIAFLYSSSFYKIKVANTRNRSANTNKAFESEDNLYFSASKAASKTHNLIGIVDFAYDVSDNPTIRYRLADENSDSIVYLVSSTNDLSILVGLKVAVKGTPTRNKLNGLDVIDVVSVQLK